MVSRFSWHALTLCILATFSASVRSNFNMNTNTFVNNGSINAPIVNLKATNLSGKGSITGNEVHIASNTFSFDGKVEATYTCILETKKFQGTGSISAENVTITCNEFGYTGTITCHSKCTIYSQNSFDYNSLKRSGKGTFTIVLTKNPIRLYTRNELVSTSWSAFSSDTCLRLTTETIAQRIKTIRDDAAINRISDTEVLQAVKDGIEKAAQFHKDRLDEKRDPLALRCILENCALTAGGLCAATGLFYFNRPLARFFTRDNDTLAVKVMAVGVAALFCTPLLTLPKEISKWQNPQHQEKYEKLMQIIACIDQAMKTIRVPEETFITLPSI